MKAGQINYKRLLLFLVEGATDKVLLENVLKKNISEKKICFKTVKGDITSEENTTPQNIESKINFYVKDFLSRNRAFRRTDITEIIHITDLDGAFVSDKRIVYDKETALRYEEKLIKSSKTFALIERNRRKSEVLKHLSSIDNIKGVGYSVYYFGINLEHVFTGDPNCCGEEKENAAFRAARSFIDREHEFLKFLEDNAVTGGLSYADSWEFASRGINSLRRITNIDLLLEKYGKKKPQ